MSDMGSTAGLRPFGVGELLDVALKLYRTNFANLVKVVALVTAPVFVLGAIIQESATPSDLESQQPGEFGEFGETTIDTDELWLFIAAILVVMLLTLVATQLASAACLKMIAASYLQETTDWRQSLRFALSRLRSLLWLTFLHTILLVPAFLACIVPGVYLYAAWAVATPALLLEDFRGRKALKRSRTLVKGRWGPVALMLLLSTLLASVVSFGITSLLGAAVFAVDSDIVAFITGAIGNVIGGALTTPFVAAVTIVLYVDLRVRREGFDLELLAQRIGVEPPPPGTGVMPTGPGYPVPPPPGEPPPFWPPPPGWRPGGGPPDA